MLVLLLELRDGSLKNESDVVQVLQLPVLAVVPTLVTTDDQRRISRRRMVLSGAVAASVVASGIVVWVMKLWRFVS